MRGIDGLPIVGHRSSKRAQFPSPLNDAQRVALERHFGSSHPRERAVLRPERSGHRLSPLRNDGPQLEPNNTNERLEHPQGGVDVARALNAMKRAQARLAAAKH